jgi:hypothetical protein
MKPIILNQNVRFILILLIAIGMSSCYKDRFDLNRLEKGGEWSPDMAAPLINSNLTLKDILNDYDHDNLITENGSGFLTLLYTRNVFSKTAEDLIVFPDTNMNSSFNFSVSGALPFGTDITAPLNIISYSFNMPYSIVIDELDVKDGMFSFTLFSPDLNHNATINVNIPSATLGGVPFNKDLNFTAGSTSSQNINLDGYKILFDNSGGNQNRLDIIYTVTLHGLGGPNNSPYHINLGESFTDIKFSKILGDLKQINFDFPKDTIDIRIFSNNIHGMVDFEDPKIHLYAYNSFGMPLEISFNNFMAVNPPSTITLINLPSPWNITAPSIIGQIATTDYHLNKTNSNIWDAIAMSPEYFVADIHGLSNPGGGISNNFALDTSRLNVDAQVEIPLFGKAWDFVLQDTTDLELGQDLENIEFMLFRLNTTNGFPVEAIQQLIFLDDANHVIDSLLTPEQQTLAPAPCSGTPDYKVTSSVLKLTEITLYNDRIKKLKNCKKVIIRAKLKTTQNGTEPVKFYSDYSINVKVGLRIKFKVNY